MQNGNPKCKIIFWGTSNFAIPALKAIVRENYEIAAVITQPDKPAGRKQVLSPPPVKILAEQLNLKIFQPKALKDDETFETFKRLNPDICIVAAYGKIIPKQYLDVPKYGFINIHPSLLPKYRGPTPIQTAILNRDKETGVTIIVVDEEMDHGPILAKRELAFQISNFQFLKLQDELAKLGAKLLIETLPKYINREIKLTEQDHSQATFTKMFKRDDGKIDWNKPAEEIYSQIQALNPEPGTWTTWNNRVINIPTCDVGYPPRTFSANINTGGEAAVAEKVRGQQVGEMPGTVTKMGNDIAVATRNEYLILGRVQLAGGKEITAREFVNGHRDFVGSVLN